MLAVDGGGHAEGIRATLGVRAPRAAEALRASVDLAVLRRPNSGGPLYRPPLSKPALRQSGPYGVGHCAGKQHSGARGADGPAQTEDALSPRPPLRCGELLRGSRASAAPVPNLPASTQSRVAGATGHASEGVVSTSLDTRMPIGDISLPTRDERGFVIFSPTGEQDGALRGQILHATEDGYYYGALSTAAFSVIIDALYPPGGHPNRAAPSPESPTPPHPQET